MTDVNDQERSENFFQTKYDELRRETREDQIEMAYLKKENEELRERVKKLASRQPSWPKGYRPQREKSHRR